MFCCIYYDCCSLRTSLLSYIRNDTEFVLITMRESGNSFHIADFARRKKEARAGHEKAKYAKKVHGIKGILHSAQRYKEKAAMRKE